MNSLIVIAGYVGSVLVNAAVLSYLAGKHSRKIDELTEWKREHSRRFDEMSGEVAYLSGRLNGGSYIHK